MLVYGECECFVMQMLYVCVLCASSGSSQCCVLHDLQFVSAVFCVISSLLMCVSHGIGDHMVETYSCMGLVMALYVAMIVSFCSPPPMLLM